MVYRLTPTGKNYGCVFMNVLKPKTVSFYRSVFLGWILVEMYNFKRLALWPCLHKRFNGHNSVQHVYLCRFCFVIEMSAREPHNQITAPRR